MTAALAIRLPAPLARVGRAALFLAASILTAWAWLVVERYVAALGMPMVTGDLLAADARLGFDWVAYGELVHRFAPWSAWVYASFMLQMVVTAPLLALMGCGRPGRFIGQVNLALLATMCCFAVFPADNAATAHGVYSPVSASWSAGLEALRSRLPVDRMDGLVSFPSFHTAGAVLLIAAWWPTRLRWPVAALELVLLIGVPAWGAHFLVDMLAGAGVALLVIASIARTR